jgi:hypothetical protein
VIATTVKTLTGLKHLLFTAATLATLALAAGARYKPK